MSEPLYIPPDIYEAHDKYEAMCGHASLAAAIRTPVSDVMPFFDNKGGWVNIPMMKKAIRKTGRNFADVHPSNVLKLNSMNIIMLQFEGPWMKSEIARCAYRHWIAAKNCYTFEVNYDGGRWMHNFYHHEFINKLLMPEKGTGYKRWKIFQLL